MRPWTALRGRESRVRSSQQAGSPSDRATPVESLRGFPPAGNALAVTAEVLQGLDV